MMRKKLRRSLGGGICALSVAVALPCTASADPVTLDFTGSIDSATGSFAAAGSTVSGTYTFNYAAADPSVSSGSLSDLSSGVSLANLVLGGPLPSSVVFTASFTSGGFSYTSPLSTAVGVLDLVSIAPGSFFATDSWILADGSGLTNSLQLLGSNVFNAAGLPVLGTDATSLGQVVDSSGVNGFTYHLTTLVQAPEIDPASTTAGITLLLAAGLVLRGRRLRASAATLRRRWRNGRGRLTIVVLRAAWTRASASGATHRPRTLERAERHGGEGWHSGMHRSTRQSAARAG